MGDVRDRLTDAELQRFLVDGYLKLRLELPAAFHRRVYDRIGTVLERSGNPHNNILPEVPELRQVFGHPQVTGALASILGNDYYLHLHRHCHDRAPGAKPQRIHQDSLYNSRYAADGNRRHHHARWAMAFYYPQDTGAAMGPTAVVPRSHYLNEAQREEDEIHLTGEAGTVVIVHYDIWHRATGYLTGGPTRYMVKFLFTRMADPARPSWRHEPAGAAPRWQTNGAAADAGRPALPAVWDYQWRWHLGAGRRALPAAANGRLGALVDRLAAADEPAALDAAYALGQGGAAAGAALAEALRSGDERVRRNAAYGFAPLGAAAVSALGGLLEDGAAAVRARAADALGDVGAPAGAAGAALSAALKDESELVRGHAADALGTVYAGAAAAAAAPAAAALAAALEDENEVVRRNAALSLARVAPNAGAAADHVAAALAGALDDASHYVRGYAVLGLRRLGTPRAHGELLGYLESARWDPSQLQA